VGKTTLARILAKCLNCTANGEGDEGVTSTPCGQCDSCRAIDEGRFVDLIEVDAASRTKVEDTRELLDNVQYAPSQGRYKVYLIDEVHMLSTSSFNALLKTLEEPPPHVKFLLATTDPHKLPPTVLSRCLQFTLKHMPPERVVEHLTYVLGEEGVAFEESALWLLGKAAEGSMRDAMSLTDQAIAFGQGAISHADVAAMLGTLDHRHVLALIEALADVDVARLLSEVSQLAEQGPDFSAVLDDVTAILHRLAVAQMVPDAVDNGHGDRDTVLALAARFTAEDVQLYYQIGIQGRGDMAHAPDLRSALEMTLLRMLAFRPQGVPKPPATPLPLQPERPPAEGPGASNAAPEPAQLSQPAPPAASVPPIEPVPPAESAPPSEPAAPPPWATDDAPPVSEPDAEPEPAPVLEPAGEPEPEPAQAMEPPSEATPPGRLDHAGWLDGFAALGLGGLTRNLAAYCQLKSDNGNTLVLRLDPSQAAMQAEIHETRIAKALAASGVERRVTLTAEALDPALETPQTRDGRLAQEHHAKALDTLNRDPHIQELKQAFGATFIQDGVTPVRHAD
jgi:DNA polymerase-3 subunit gamma/tau